MGERPRRKRVRAEPLVHERERRFHVRIDQVGKHRLDLVGRQHALVGERIARQAHDVEAQPLGAGQGVHRVLDALPDHIELALEGGASSGRVARSRQLRAAPDEDLPEGRLDGDCRRADKTVVRRHVAPAEDDLAFFAHRLLEEGLDLAARRRIGRQEHEAGAVLAGRRQRDARGGPFPCAGIDPASASGCRRRLPCSARSRRRRDEAG